MYTYDHQGMGYISTNNATPTIPLYADDAAGMITALGYDSMHVYGASVGSSTAQQRVIDHTEGSALYDTLRENADNPNQTAGSGSRHRQILYGTEAGTDSPEFRKIPCSLWEPLTR